MFFVLEEYSQHFNVKRNPPGSKQFYTPSLKQRLECLVGKGVISGFEQKHINGMCCKQLAI